MHAPPPASDTRADRAPARRATAPARRATAVATAIALAMSAPALLLCATAGCRYPATQVFVRFDTDAPADRALTVEATVRSGADSAGETRQWARGGGGGGASLALPASFTLVPGAGPRDGPVVVTLTAVVAPPAPPAAPLVIRRIARFAFTPRTTTAVTLFLSVRCAAPATGCTEHDAATCTVGTRCEEQGLTCGDNGECTSRDVVPVIVPPDQVMRPDAAATDASATDTTPPPPDVVATDGQPADGGLFARCPATLPPTWVFCDDFEGGDFPARYNSTSILRALGLVDTQAASGTHSLQASYVTGTNATEYVWVAFGRNPIWSGAARPSEDFTDVYWRVRVLHDVGWVGNPLALTRAVVVANAPFGVAARAVLDGMPGELTLLADPATCVAAGAVSCSQLYQPEYRYLGQFGGSALLYAPSVSNQWNCVEAHMRLNTPGASDGVFEFWVNDTLDGARNDLDWRGTYQTYGINAAGIDSGWGDAPAPRDERRWFDDFVIATTRIGCR